MSASVPANERFQRAVDAGSFERAKVLVQRIVGGQFDRPSLVSAIALEVGAEIIEGLRKPGDDLNSVELSRRFSTSRTPIREALMFLEKEGMVVVSPRKRPRVARLDIDEIREIYRVRAALFELVAHDVARSAPVRGLDSLEKAFGAMDAAFVAGDLSRFVWANVDFYDSTLQLAGNRSVKRILDSLLLRTARLRRLSLSRPGRMERSHDDHARILRAFKDRDATLAAALFRSNHINALAALEACYQVRDDGSGQVEHDLTPGDAARNRSTRSAKEFGF